MLANQVLVTKYELRCRESSWPEKQLLRSPQWAAWFARSVLIDRWPAAEPLIETDEIVRSRYLEYVGIMRKIGILDHSVGLHQMKKDREEAQSRVTGAQLALRYGEAGAILRYGMRG